MRIIHGTTGEALFEPIENAGSFFARSRGLLGRRGLPPGHALLIRRCRILHTLGMRFALDLIFLDAENRVTAVCTHVPPGRIRRGPRGTVAVLETVAGRVAPRDLPPGTPLRIES